MSTWNRCAAAGAGPSAEIRLDGETQVARRRAARKTAIAGWTSPGSGPNLAAYSEGKIVFSAASSAASSSACRALRLRLRDTAVAVSAGPRSVADLIALASVGAGLGTGMVFVWARWACVLWQAEIKTAANIAVAAMR